MPRAYVTCKLIPGGLFLTEQCLPSWVDAASFALTKRPSPLGGLSTTSCPCKQLDFMSVAQAVPPCNRKRSSLRCLRQKTSQISVSYGRLTKMHDKHDRLPKAYSRTPSAR